MAEKKIIAIVGATGAQGGGLARAIAADRSGPFAGRAITRKPDSAKAKALAAQGLEVAAADLDDEKSLARAFAGAHGAYCVTNFWEHLSPEKELVQAGNMARAAATAGLSHVVWSTLEDTRLRIPLSDPRLPTLRGKYKVPHFDAKGEADALFANLPTTYLLASWYFDNIIHFGAGPRRMPDGSVVFALPLGGGRLPGIATEDIGRCAYGIFRRGAEMIGRRAGIAGEILSGPEMAAELARAVGEPVKFFDMPFDQYRALGFPGADDLGNMFEYQAIFNDEFCRTGRSVELARSLNPALQSFAQWVDRHREEIRIG